MSNYRIQKSGKNWIIIEVKSENIILVAHSKREADKKLKSYKDSFEGFSPAFIFRKVA